MVSLSDSKAEALREDVWKTAILPSHSIIKDAIRSLNESGLRIVLVLDAEGRLEGTISDGDIRRGLLVGLDLSSSVESITHRDALVVPPSFSRDVVMQLMHSNNIQQIPVIDDNQRLVGLHLWNQINSLPQRDNLLVIMAGGKGTRLMPHTENCPKPLISVAGKPMLQHIIERARAEGFVNFVLATHYLGHMIEEYFGNGSPLNVKIEYLREDIPLGTAGALSLLQSLPTSPIVVTNGDVMTDVSYGEVLDFHARYSAAATMAVRVHEWQHPFGVVQMDGVDVIGFEEKPISRTHINAGVYALSPEALKYMQIREHCDMPSLFMRLIKGGLRVVAYPMHEPWLDVGRPDDLKVAKEAVARKIVE